MSRKTDYNEYIKSKAWESKRKKKLSLVKRCEMDYDRHYLHNGRPIPVCKGPLHVHHKTYDRLGNERMEDLQVLCEFHHGRVHEAQNAHEKRKKAITTFGNKKYGRGWLSRMPYDVVAREFYEWLESKS